MANLFKNKFVIFLICFVASVATVIIVGLQQADEMNSKNEIFEADPEDILSTKDQQCKENSDCTIVYTSCGGCGYGTPINKKFEAKYKDQRRKMCEDFDGVIEFCNPLSSVYPQCFQGECVSSYDHPKSFCLGKLCEEDLLYFLFKATY